MMGWARMNQMRNRALASGGRGFSGGGGFDPNSESTPPSSDTTPYATVSNTGTVNDSNWDRPGFRGRPEFRTARNNAPPPRGRTFLPSMPAGAYHSGIWNPFMRVGSQNMFGGIYRGLVYGPNRDNSGSDWHTVFTPGGGDDNSDGAGYQSVGFGSYPSIGLLSQKML